MVTMSLLDLVRRFVLAGVDIQRIEYLNLEDNLRTLVSMYGTSIIASRPDGRVFELGSAYAERVRNIQATLPKRKVVGRTNIRLRFSSV